MSVINSMLRDLDRRHAPSPFKGNVSINANVQPSLTPSSRVAPRSAIALCMLIGLVILSWNQHFKKTDEQNTSAKKTISSTTQSQAAAPAQPTITEKTTSQQKIEAPEPTNRRLTESFATTRREPIHGGSESASMPPTIAANNSVNRPALRNSATDKKEVTEETEEPAMVAATKAAIPETKTSAPIVKQERKTDSDLNTERYQLARNALAQNQPQRAYELLKDNPPALASNTDYHAVLAAVEQQLKHFADASLRYQQLLIVDQTQSSWWLGLALSLEGQHRNADALAAYRRAISLNSLPDAAREYAITRIAALNHSAE